MFFFVFYFVNLERTEPEKNCQLRKSTYQSVVTVQSKWNIVISVYGQSVSVRTGWCSGIVTNYPPAVLSWENSLLAESPVVAGQEERQGRREGGREGIKFEEAARPRGGPIAWRRQDRGYWYTGPGLPLQPSRLLTSTVCSEYHSQPISCCTGFSHTTFGNRLDSQT